MPRVATTPNGLPLRLVFARNVRLLRVHLGMSQEKLAAEASLDRAFVGTLERGQRNISIDNVERLCGVLGRPAHELLAPDFPARNNLDETLTRAARNPRPYPVSRRSHR